MAIDYQKIINTTFLNVVRQILTETAENGLEQPNHFYITFQTNARNVNIPDFLKQRYPDEMTIVLQHQFQNLRVDEKCFSVDLSFNGKFWNLTIPFSSLIAFVYSSAQFALQFQPQNDPVPMTVPKTQQTAEVIDLNALRNGK